jgi:hypothetical protein
MIQNNLNALILNSYIYVLSYYYRHHNSTFIFRNSQPEDMRMLQNGSSAMQVRLFLAQLKGYKCIRFAEHVIPVPARLADADVDVDLLAGLCAISGTARVDHVAARSRRC